jgi:hypothetical protein
VQGYERGRVGPAALAPIGITLALLLGVSAVGYGGHVSRVEALAWVTAEDGLPSFELGG